MRCFPNSFPPTPLFSPDVGAFPLLGSHADGTVCGVSLILASGSLVLMLGPQRPDQPTHRAERARGQLGLFILTSSFFLKHFFQLTFL